MRTATVPSGRALDPGAVLADVRAGAGGEPDLTDVVEPLAVLTDALAAEARLHPAGVEAAGARLRDLLGAYAGMQADTAGHPGIDDQPVGDPIVIVGLPRSGTTLLHGLLSADPGHRAPVFWEALRPSPPPATDPEGAPARRAAVQAQFDAMIARNPSLLASLPYSADLAAECNTLTQPTLRSIAFTAHYHVPRYQRWYLHEASPAPSFRYHRRALQQLQWRAPAARWVLKAPPHLLAMDDLVAAYPGALLVQTHRDPARVMASVCALSHANRVLHSDDPVAHQVGADALDLWATGCDRAVGFRRRRPDVAVTDVRYDDLGADPLGTVAGIYAAGGIELTDDAVASMEAWLVANARDRRPVEHHTLEEFGLARDRVDERFAAYRTAHDL